VAYGLPQYRRGDIIVHYVPAMSTIVTDDNDVTGTPVVASLFPSSNNARWRY
jgi:hypothetical protein